MNPHLQELPKLTMVGLSHHCEAETRQYFNGQTPDTRYCYELFRRALENPHEESSAQAWQFILIRYKSLVKGWVHRHAPPNLSSTIYEELTQDSFNYFWVAFAKEPDRFQKFPDVKHLLRFLYWQVRGAIKSYPFPHTNEEDINLEHLPLPASQPSPSLVWECVSRHLDGEQEQVIAYYSFVEECRPGHIWELYRNADLFESIKEIHRVKERILKRLRRQEPQLRDCLSKG